jgi:hydrogenase expression/formation protein HypD
MSNNLPGFIADFKLRYSDMNCTLMEVCGTHTNAIRKAGIHQLLPEGIRLLSGPGCPVCVTGGGYIEQAIRLSQNPKVIIATFGDLLKVPGNSGNLAEARAVGGRIRVVYSPLDAVAVAAQSPDWEVVFLGVGFETTAPVIGLAVKEARHRGIKNFSVLPALKVLNPALECLLADPDLAIDGLIAPGHLSVITGAGAFAFVPEKFGLPTVITGFRTGEIWLGLAALAGQIQQKVARLENMYPGAVSDQGNLMAQLLLKEVFAPEDTEWRGLGTVPGSGLGFSGNYLDFDARARFGLEPVDSNEPPGCICGLILLGKAGPGECPHFNRACNPEHPVGPCMVSAEGTCAAHFYYDRQLETAGTKRSKRTE